MSSVFLRQHSLLRNISCRLPFLQAYARSESSSSETAITEFKPDNSVLYWHKYPVLISCVLERLPVLQPPAPEWLKEHMRWETEKLISTGFIKEYPKQKRDEFQEAQVSSIEGVEKFIPVSSLTKHDKSGNFRTMKRKLSEKVFLLVKYKKDEEEKWSFPSLKLKGDETLRFGSQRVINSTMGQIHPIFYMGNCPIGHARLIEKDDTLSAVVFYMLAQAVEEPWEVQLLPESGAVDHAWVTKSEIPKFITDFRLQDLYARML